MSNRELKIIIAGDGSGAQKAFDAVSRSGGGLTGVMKNVGLAATAGLGAVIAGAGASVVAAAGFQDQMKEVFTLLPDISQAAMGSMTGQVKDLSNEFGVLPQDVVPALYSALSAGVPEGNVFDFLEVAQKAAKGGVTDLEIAVDGISSVMNAYGSDVIGAAEASDLMFTAVRLGKTNMEELSSSLFNVTPTAAALGVGFEQVTASIASLTAQGVPTSVATTQMRAAFVELGKEGSTAFDAFKTAAGATFPEFIAEGGNLGEAVRLMGDHANTTGTSMLNLFGSVEAGGAFTALAADADGFDEILTEMGGSAGATQAAFDTMNTGLSATLDRLKARFATTAITVGEHLLPKVEAVSTWALDKGVPAVKDLIDRFTPLAEVIRDDVVGAFESLVDFAEDSILPVIQTVRDAFAEDGLAGVFDLAKRKAAEFGPAVAAVAAVAVVAFGAWAISAGAAAIATIAAAAPLIAIAAAVAGVAAAFTWAYQNSDSFRESVDAVVGFIKDNWRPTFEFVADVVTTYIGKVRDVVEPLVGMFVDTVQLLKALFEGDFDRVWQEAKSIVSNAIGAIVAYFREFPLTALSAFLGAAGTLLSGLGSWFTDTAAPKVGEWLGSWTTAVVDFVAGIPGAIADVALSAFDGLWDGFKSVWNEIADTWNNLGLTIPRVEFDVPFDGRDAYGFGGNTIGIPSALHIPRLHSAGVFLPPNLAGEGLAVLSRGERLLTPSSAVPSGDDTPVQVNVLLDSQVLVSALENHGKRRGPLNIRVTG